MKRIVIILLLMAIIGCDHQKQTKPETIGNRNYIPKNLDEAIHQMDLQLSDSLKLEIKKITEEDFTLGSHFGFGLGIRNDWKLWKGSELSRYFNKIGIFHPDDMSGIILTSYYRNLQGLDIKLDAQVSYYKEYWDGAKVTELPQVSEHPEEGLEFKTSKLYGHITRNKTWGTVFIQSNSKDQNFWIYDYYYGWKKVDLKTKEKLDSIDMEKIESFLNHLFQKNQTIKTPQLPLETDF